MRYVRHFGLFDYLGLSVNHSGVGRGGVMEPLGGRVGGCDTASGGSLWKKGWRGGKDGGRGSRCAEDGLCTEGFKGDEKTIDYNYSAGILSHAHYRMLMVHK